MQKHFWIQFWISYSIFFSSITVGIGMHAYMLSHSSCVPHFATLWTVTRQAPLSVGFSRQEYWSGLPCPPPGDLLDPRIKPVSPVSPALQTDSLLLSHQGSLGIGMGLLQLDLLIFEKYQINSVI